MGTHRPLLDPGTVLTDMVSLKGPLQDRAEELGLQEAYVGSHPMAGGEGRGFEASRSDLFRGARIWTVPGGAPPELRRDIDALWKGLGAHPSPVEAEAHDRLMAWVSHLPQLTANALALALEREGLGRRDLGPGGRDMTRLAGSAPEMWEDLFRWAPPDTPAALEGLQKALAELKALLESGRADQVAARMARTRTWTKEDA